MTKRSQQLLAIFLIALGALYLVANFFENIDAGALFWPLAFILIGVYLIFRPKSVLPDNAEHYFAKDIFLGEGWKPGDKEVRMFAGDIDIDLRTMDLQDGENHYWVKFFAGDITLDVPEDDVVSMNRRLGSSMTASTGAVNTAQVERGTTGR